MAQLPKNSPLQGVRGTIGDLVFRQLYGKTIVSSKPGKTKKEPSGLQSHYQNRFAEASQYAKEVTKAPDQKAKYKEIAARLGLPNAYTAALKEYLQQPKIEAIDESKYTGTAGDSILITASKQDFPVKEVIVCLLDEENNVLEEGPATKLKARNQWVYTAKEDFLDGAAIRMLVNVSDLPGNVVGKEIVLR